MPHTDRLEPQLELACQRAPRISHRRVRARTQLSTLGTRRWLWRSKVWQPWIRAREWPVTRRWSSPRGTGTRPQGWDSEQHCQQWRRLMLSLQLLPPFQTLQQWLDRGTAMGFFWAIALCLKSMTVRTCQRKHHRIKTWLRSHLDSGSKRIAVSQTPTLSSSTGLKTLQLANSWQDLTSFLPHMEWHWLRDSRLVLSPEGSYSSLSLPVLLTTFLKNWLGCHPSSGFTILCWRSSDSRKIS